MSDFDMKDVVMSILIGVPLLLLVLGAILCMFL